jgi:hypothetical protein
MIVKPSCVFIRKIDINGFQPAFLRVVNGLFHISSPIFDLPEKGLARMPYNQRSLPGLWLPLPKIHSLSALFRAIRVFALIFLGRFHPVAYNVELQNHAVMHQPVNGSSGHHRVFKDLLPLGERQYCWLTC